MCLRHDAFSRKRIERGRSTDGLCNRVLPCPVSILIHGPVAASDENALRRIDAPNDHRARTFHTSSYRGSAAVRVLIVADTLEISSVRLCAYQPRRSDDGRRGVDESTWKVRTLPVRERNQLIRVRDGHLMRLTQVPGQVVDRESEPSTALGWAGNRVQRTV